MAELPAGSNLKPHEPLWIGQLDRSVAVSPVGTRLLQGRLGCVLFKPSGSVSDEPRFSLYAPGFARGQHVAYAHHA